jgi:hypothetical protein
VGWGVTTFTTPIAVSSDGLVWTRPSTGLSLNLNGVLHYQGKLFAYNKTVLLQSSDGAAWTPVSTTAPNLEDLTVFHDKLTAATPAGIQSSEDGVSWQITAGGLSPAPLCIHGTDTLCWAGSVGGSIFHSADAENWTVPPAGPPGAIADMCWWKGNWYAVGSSIGISPDADGWRFATKPSGHALRCIGTSDTTLVSAGDGGTILRSTNGSEWTIQRSGFALPIHDVSWTGSRWVAVGGFPYMLTSDDDGVTWQEPSPQPAQQFMAIASGGGATVAVSSSTGAGLVSTDGQTWQEVLISDQGLNDVAHDGECFVAVGRFGTIRRSTNGLDWTSPTSPAGTHWETIGAAPGGGFVAAGSYVAARSADGSNWDLAETAATASWAAVATSGSGWLMTDSGAPGEHVFSDDGLHWQTVWSELCPVQDTIAASNELVIGSRVDSPDGNTIIYKGTSPTRWTPQYLSPPSGSIRDTHWTGQAFLVTGRFGRVWKSSDGVAWNSSYLGEDIRLRQSASLNGRIISVGDDGLIAYTDDFSIWSQPASGTSATLNAIATGTPGCVAGGDYGILLFSTNGETWVSSTGGPLDSVKDIIWANGSFHAVGDFSGTYSSSDGMHWTPHPVPHGPSQLVSIAWSGTRFVAGGEGNSVITSTDGVSWESRRTPLHAVNDIAWTGSCFIAVHSTGVIVSEDDSITWGGGSDPWESSSQGINGGIARFLGGPVSDLPGRMPRIAEQSGQRVLEFTRAADSPDHTTIAVEQSLDLIHWETMAYRSGDGHWFGSTRPHEVPGSGGSVVVKLPLPKDPPEPAGFHRLRAWNTEPSN